MSSSHFIQQTAWQCVWLRCRHVAWSRPPSMFLKPLTSSWRTQKRVRYKSIHLSQMNSKQMRPCNLSTTPMLRTYRMSELQNSRTQGWWMSHQMRNSSVAGIVYMVTLINEWYWDSMPTKLIANLIHAFCIVKWNLTASPFVLCSPSSRSKPAVTGHREPLLECPERSQPGGVIEEKRQAMDIDEEDEKRKAEKKKITQQKFFTIQVISCGYNDLLCTRAQEVAERKRDLEIMHIIICAPKSTCFHALISLLQLSALDKSKCNLLGSTVCWYSFPGEQPYLLLMCKGLSKAHLLKMPIILTLESVAFDFYQLLLVLTECCNIRMEISGRREWQVAFLLIYRKFWFISCGNKKKRHWLQAQDLVQPMLGCNKGTCWSIIWGNK